MQCTYDLSKARLTLYGIVSSGSEKTCEKWPVVLINRCPYENSKVPIRAFHRDKTLL